MQRWPRDKNTNFWIAFLGTSSSSSSQCKSSRQQSLFWSLTRKGRHKQQHLFWWNRLSPQRIHIFITPKCQTCFVAALFTRSTLKTSKTVSWLLLLSFGLKITRCSWNITTQNAIWNWGNGFRDENSERRGGLPNKIPNWHFSQQQRISD